MSEFVSLKELIENLQKKVETQDKMLNALASTIEDMLIGGSESPLAPISALENWYHRYREIRAESDE